MKGNGKRNRLSLVIPVVIYIVSVVCLFWFHPFVASAKENVPGGKGNKVHVYNTYTGKASGVKVVIDRTFVTNNDKEMIGYIKTYKTSEGVIFSKDVEFAFCGSGVLSNPSVNYLSDYVGVQMQYNKKGELTNSWAYSESNILQHANYYMDSNEYTGFIYAASGMKLFQDYEAAKVYAETGSLDGMIKDEVDRNWYLKDIRCVYNKNGSPDPTADADVATIDFSWLTENLQEGDLLEVRTHNYIVKIGGDKLSGFLDYVTWRDGVSCLDDIYKDKDDIERSMYKIGRFSAVNEWLNTLDNKPLLMKDKDTDIYYMRPYRNGKYGLWCRLAMGRRADGDPYIADISYGDLDDENNYDEDEEVTEKEGGHHGVDEDGNYIDPVITNPFDGFGLTEIFKSFFDFMKGLPSLLGDLPELVKSVVGFLPDWVIGFIGISIVVVIILRILGR